MPETVANALLKFAKDTDDDIRLSVFYDVAEYPDLFTTYRDVFKQVANSAIKDPNKKVGERARRAFKTLA